MKKMINTIIGFFAFLIGIASLYFIGKKKGFEKALDDQIKKDNKNLSDEVHNLEKAKNIETTTAMASDDDVINGLRDCVSKDDNN